MSSGTKSRQKMLSHRPVKRAGMMSALFVAHVDKMHSVNIIRSEHLIAQFNITVTYLS